MGRLLTLTCTFACLVVKGDFILSDEGDAKQIFAEICCELS